MTVSIIEAMDEPQLFMPWFSGESWSGWRVVLKAAFALPMTGDEIEFFRSIADREPPRQRVKELWCVVGRRGGKDSVASVIAAHSAALFDSAAYLRPGERAQVMCLAADRDQAKIISSYARSYFIKTVLLKQLVQRETASGFELTNGVDIAVATNSFRSVRGRPVLVAVLDEVAFWRSEESQNPDEEVYKALVPSLATIPGSMLVGISSPYRKTGLLFRKFRQHYGRNDDNVLVIRAPTRTLNPTISQSVIDQALTDDPAAARAEWLAEFRDDIGGWLEREIIEASVDAGIAVRPPRAGISYRAFSDPSGGRGDSFTTAIAHDERGIAVLDCLIEIKPPFNPSAATAEISETLKSYRVNRTKGDRYAAEWVVAAFSKCGINYEHSDRDRSSLYQDALPLFTSGRVRLLDNQRLVSQFASLERKTSSMGKDRIDHGPGGHDDLCNAAAGALVSPRKAPLIVTDEILARSRELLPYRIRRVNA
ncbi:MAG: hypothetical protein K2W78_15155 [Xanthobacteraceae bacterium]|nr:hypothetical protein [Xanthobacteraceae bacterium]